MSSDRDLAALGERFEAIMAAERELIGAAHNGELKRAKLILAAGRRGEYEVEALSTVAIGVELMALAVDEHYRALGPRSEGDPSLSILAGDRLYALAMEQICSVGRPDLTKIAASTVEAIASSEATAGWQSRESEDGRMGREQMIDSGALAMVATVAGLSETDLAELTKEPAWLSH